MSFARSHPAAARAFLRERDGDNCHICGQLIDFGLPPGYGRGQSIEHVKPLAAGGTWNLGNLRLAHAFPCNHSKGASYDGSDAGRHDSPYGIGKHYRKGRPKYNHPLRGDWDTPVAPCAPEGVWFESWSAGRPG